MTGVDKDLATLRDWIGDPEDYSDEDRGAAERACDACDGVEAELFRLREQRDATLRMVWRIATRGVGADTTPEEALATIATYVENKKRARRMRP